MVIMLIAIVTSMATPFIGSIVDGERLSSAARKMGELFRSARQTAIVDGITVSVALDKGGVRVLPVAAGTDPFADEDEESSGEAVSFEGADLVFDHGIRLLLSPPRGRPEPIDDPVVVRFNRSGFCVIPPLLLQHRNESVRLSFNPLTATLDEEVYDD